MFGCMLDAFEVALVVNDMGVIVRALAPLHGPLISQVIIVILCV